MNHTTLSARSSSLRTRMVQGAVAFAICVLLACVSFALSGCKPPQGQLAANAALAEMNAIQQKDPSAIDYLPEVSQASQLEQIGISQEEFFSWWLDGFSYSLGDVEMNGEENEAKIFASVKCRQLEPVIRQWSDEYVAWLLENKEAIEAGQSEDPLAHGRELLKSTFENAEIVLTQTEVLVRKYDDEWSVVGDQENAVYGDALLGSTDNLSGYYAAPLTELATLNVALPADSAAAEDQQSTNEDDSSNE